MLWGHGNTSSFPISIVKTIWLVLGFFNLYIHVCACVCERERKKERERGVLLCLLNTAYNITTLVHIKFIIAINIIVHTYIPVPQEFSTVLDLGVGTVLE